MLIIHAYESKIAAKYTMTCFINVNHALNHKPSDIKLACGLNSYSVRFK